MLCDNTRRLDIKHDHGSSRVGFRFRLGWVKIGVFMCNYWVGSSFFLVWVKILARARPVTQSVRVVFFFFEWVELCLSGWAANDVY
jgi:hypothetical protein